MKRSGRTVSTLGSLIRPASAWPGKTEGGVVDDTATWKLIHDRRSAMADTLASLALNQWAEPSLCGGWSVQAAAGHILNGAEQTQGNFMKGMVVNGFRFNTMMDRAARRTGALPPPEIVERLRATTTTTNRPPAPVVTMLGEIVVHGEDIRRPLGLQEEPDSEALAACLEMYSKTSFPVGAKKRIAGLRVIATDTDWAHGAGPEVTGPGLSLLLAVLGRSAGLDGLAGDGLGTLRSRVSPAG
jgi:uncharacterized protein (TIGR03083 family)